ncbi:putative 1-phosphatidylinositol-3-phosphate 5-kinase FAB1C isoform X2 [Selaginella moellendorffii]|uniref:putative 1-phosphatidylinositol-3-phosphate 5-kinase FAB1C isoform X2 n=1 Tax=Selaginella moellendorffii TaxID=88036 RepID=UPI000D1D0339|nr:putative 1-phosphatidylinositol-3-phosphate 5-kinase FAB1C isoform X2 [Selaginella moellendorffii]|eukprot:XP_024538908.1 putative 1-phosphatidylinositol-3-phosphate 5-kinase FAB1C isoform X2 [Selaginella moellendorffii]
MRCGRNAALVSFGCRKSEAQGGKNVVFFAKPMDDRFIVKQVTRTELLSFLEFAPEYFFDSLDSGSPTCLAKILGMYEVIIKGGKEGRMDLMVMKNLLYGRHATRPYDLKGLVRSRSNSESKTGPVGITHFFREQSQELLERTVWNDTSFLCERKCHGLLATRWD